MTNPGAGMPCPVCAVPLVMSDRQGVEIDYCPQCRGVWLDRGELDKIIERTRANDPLPPAPQVQAVHVPHPAPAPHYDPRPHHAHDRNYYRPDDPRRYKRRKSFLEELFD